MFRKLFRAGKSDASAPADSATRAPTSDQARAEARANPDGWIYEIGGGFDAHGAVPPQAIKGAWKVDENGEITDEYKANPNYDPAVRKSAT